MVHTVEPHQIMCTVLAILTIVTTSKKEFQNYLNCHILFWCLLIERFQLYCLHLTKTTYDLGSPTEASLISHPSSHAVPHLLSLQTFIRPSVLSLPFNSLMLPFSHLPVTVVMNGYMIIVKKRASLSDHCFHISTH